MSLFTQAHWRAAFNQCAGLTAALALPVSTNDLYLCVQACLTPLPQVTPEFSVRLMDESFHRENETIQQIQGKMVQYFQGRSGKLAQDGISGPDSVLQQTFCCNDVMWLHRSILPKS